MGFKSAVLGFVVVCGLGLSACGASDSANSKPVETRSSSSDKEVLALSNEYGLLFDDSSSVEVVDDPVVASVAPEFSEPVETTPLTEGDFVIRVSKKEPSSFEKLAVLEYGEVNASFNLETPRGCDSVKLDKDKLKLPLNIAENDKVLRQFVFDAYWSCFFRPKYPESNNVLYKSLKDVAVKDGATIADLEDRSKEVMRTVIYSHKELECMRGTHDCIVKVDLVASEGYSLQYSCDFDQAVVPHENAKIRLKHLCKGADLDIKIVSVPEGVPDVFAPSSTRS